MVLSNACLKRAFRPQTSLPRYSINCRVAILRRLRRPRRVKKNGPHVRQDLKIVLHIVRNARRVTKNVRLSATTVATLRWTVGMIAGPTQVHQDIVGCMERRNRHDHRVARTNFAGRSAIEPWEPSALAKPAAIRLAATAAGSILAK